MDDYLFESGIRQSLSILELNRGAGEADKVGVLKGIAQVASKAANEDVLATPRYELRCKSRRIPYRPASDGTTHCR